jgi:hypothetical protein
MGKLSIIGEFWQFVKQEKKYWLFPLIVVLVLLGIVIVFMQSSALAPFLYPFF